MVQSLTRLGANVYTIDIGPTAPAELETHSNVWCTPNGNVADVAVCKAFVDSIPGDIHGLVNCAGVSPFEDKLASYELYRQIIEVNITGTWAMATEVIRRMIQQEPLKCVAGMESSPPQRSNLARVLSSTSLVAEALEPYPAKQSIAPVNMR